MSLTIPLNAALTRMQIEDLRLASSKMTGVRRRAFHAEIALKDCQGNARLTELVFGWGRNTVKTGLAEKRTGMVCVGAQSCFSGRKRWEEQHPEAFAALQTLTEAHCQQDPTFTSTIAFTRLTAAAALEQLSQQGFSAEELSSPSAMAEILNRSGYRLRKVLKAKPQKTASNDAIFANIKLKDSQEHDGSVKRLSMDCKATVKLGDSSRPGKSRTQTKASDHDMGDKAEYIPCERDRTAVWNFSGTLSVSSQIYTDAQILFLEEMYGFGVGL